jgi:hypothetical protein
MVRNKREKIPQKNIFKKITVRDGALALKGSRSTGGGRIFLKTRRGVSFNKVLWNEPTFGLIHLAGQYL